MHHEKWVSKDYIVAWAASFLLTSNFYLYMVTTSGYALHTFGVSTVLAGLSTSIFVLAAIVTRLIMGGRIFHVGCIRALSLGLGLNAVFSACYFFTGSYGLLLAVRIMHGLSIGIASTAIFTVGSVLIPKNKTGIGMGYFSLSTTLGTAVGPFVAAALTRSGSYTSLFTVTLIAAVLNVCLIPFIKLNNANLPDPRSLTKPLKGLAGIIDTKELPVAIICGIAF